MIESEAKSQNKILNHHWAHILIHGMLHLIGYDHEKEKEAVLMETTEIELLNEINIPNPYAV